MKNFSLILLSCLSLILAACSGGGDGGGSTPSQVSLTVSQPDKGGTISGSPTGSYEYGAKVALVFTPRFGYSLKGWLGADCPSEGDCIITLTSSKNISAIVEAIPYTLTLEPFFSNNFTTDNCYETDFILKNIEAANYNPVSATEFTLGGASSLEYYLDSSCTSLGNKVTIPAGSNRGKFFMKSTTTGAKTFTLSGGGANFTRQFNFYNDFSIAPDNSTNPNLYVLATLQKQFSAQGNGVGNLVFSISSGGGVIDYTGLFTAPPYKGITKIRLTDSVTTIYKEVTVMIEPIPTTVVYPNLPNFFEVDECNSVPFQIRDGYGQSLLSGVVTQIDLSAAGDVTVYGDSNCTQVISSIEVPAGMSDGIFYLKTPTRGLKTFKFKTGLIDFDKTIDFFNALRITPQNDFVFVTKSKQFTVTGGIGTIFYEVLGELGTINQSGLFAAPNSVGTAVVKVTDPITTRTNQTNLQIIPLPQTAIFSGVPAYAEINSCVAVNYLIKDNNNANIFSPRAIPINLVSSTGVSFFSDDTCSTQITGTNIGVQVSTGIFYVKATATGSRSFNFNITNTAVNSNLSINFRDPLILTPTNDYVQTTKTKQFNVQNNLGSVQFTILTSGSSTTVGEINSSGLYTAPAGYSIGSVLIKATDSITGINKQVSLRLEPLASSIDLSSLGTYAIVNKCVPIIFGVKDNQGNPLNAGITYPLNFINATDINFYSDSACVNAVTGITIPINTSTSTFYIKGVATGTRSFTSVIAPAVNTTRNVTFYNEVTLSPETSTIFTTQTKQMVGNGGIASLQYVVVSGGGTINSSGLYTAPAGKTTAVVRVTDPTTSAFKEATIVVEPLVSALVYTTVPSNAAVNSCNQVAFTLKDNSGNNLNSGVSTTLNATSANGIAFFSDSSCQTTTSTVTVAAGSANGVFYIKSGSAATSQFQLQIGALNSSRSIIFYDPISLSPGNSKIYISGQVNYVAAGGIPPYTYSVVSGSGSFTGSVYKSTTATSASVKVTDSIGLNITATVQVAAELSAPTSVPVVVRTTTPILVTGGFSPYSYSVLSGGGSIDLAGTYTAPNDPGAAQVRVTDANGATKTVSINIVDSLSLDPTSVILTVNSSKQFNAAGGLPPYTFSIVSGNGSITASGGMFTASSTATNSIIKVKDSMNNEVEANIQIIPLFAIVPATANLVIGQSQQISAVGGLPPYSFAVTSGGGSLDSSGLYTAGATPETVQITAYDSNNQTKVSTITVVKPLQISPALVIIPVSTTQQFAASFGLPPYSYTVQSGGGTINSTGLFTAPVSGGTSVVRVTDTMNNFATATVQSIATFVVSPLSTNMITNQNLSINASGGLAPYQYTILSGGGSVSAAGVYTAGPTAESVQLRVQDGIDQIKTVSINVVEPLTLTPSSVNMVANTTRQFTATKGLPPYTYSVVSGGGSINSSGLYTAPAVPATVVIKVRDFMGTEVQANISVFGSLSPTLSSSTVVSGTRAQFTFTGGSGNVSIDFIQNGNIGSNVVNGFYYAGYTQSTVSEQIRITDNLTGEVKTSPVISVTPLTTSRATVSLGDNSEFIGESLAADATTLVVGSPLRKNISGEVTGGVTVYKLVSGVWSNPVSIQPPTLQIGDEFGRSVALSGTLLVIGAPGRNTINNQEGIIFTYRYNGSSWSLINEISPSSPENNMRFGQKVGIINSGSEELVVASALGTNSRGVVQVFNGTSLLSSYAGSLSNERMGSGLSTYNEYLAIGIPNRTHSAITQAGEVNVYIRRSGSWVGPKVIRASNPVANDNFGESVAIGYNGKIAVGSPNRDDTGASDQGAFYTFYRKNDDSYAGEAMTLDPFPTASGKFGSSLSLNTDYLAVGKLGSPLGVSLFEHTSNYSYKLTTRALSISSNAAASYGKAVVLTDSHVLVGEPGGNGNILSYSYSMTPSWPTGTDGDLVIASGSTVTLSPGTLKNYRNLTVQSGGVLEISDGGSWTMIGVSGNLIVDGTIRSINSTHTGGTFNATAPNKLGVLSGESLSFSCSQNSGGNGGNSRQRGYGGGGTSSGNGGGGAGDDGGGGGASLTRGGDGGPTSGGAGSFGFGDPGDNAGSRGGGGGGFRGRHGGAIYLKVKGNISGSGSVNVNGSNGTAGGSGSGYNENYTYQCNPHDVCTQSDGKGTCLAGETQYDTCTGTYNWGGGGGGGGAGGSGGSIVIRSRQQLEGVQFYYGAGAGGGGGSGGNGAGGGGGASNGNPGSFSSNSSTF